MDCEGGEVYFKITQLIMALRNTPNFTGQTGCELMFGRKGQNKTEPQEGQLKGAK